MRIEKRTTLLLACLLVVLVGVLATLGWHASQPAYGADTALKADRTDAIAVQNAITSVAEDLKPSVVYITAERITKTDGMPDIEDFFRGFPFPFPRGGETRRSVAAGSGVIVRSDGYILTNDHVISGADRVTVRLSDDREFPGKVLRDPRTDLALVKIDAKNLPAARLGDSEKVKVGQWAIAIGNPFGLTNTVTCGVVSALTREATVPDPSAPGGARFYPDLIQTDASINAGNSGGPLVNINGEVIGINAVIESPTGTNAGIGFAVPSSTAKDVMEQLIEHGKVVRGYMGLEPKDVSPAAAKTLGTSKGALVNSVEDDSPAGKAGIKPMDVIVEIGGQKIDDALALRRIVAGTKPATKVPVVIIRDGKRQTLQVTIGEAPEELAKSPGEAKSKLGLSVQDLTPELVEQLGLGAGTKGVLVKTVDADGAAARANPPLRARDVILKINDQPTKTVAQFEKAAAGLKSGDTALVLLQRGNRTTISELTID